MFIKERTSAQSYWYNILLQRFKYVSVYFVSITCLYINSLVFFPVGGRRHHPCSAWPLLSNGSGHLQNNSQGSGSHFPLFPLPSCPAPHFPHTNPTFRDGGLHNAGSFLELLRWCNKDGEHMQLPNGARCRAGPGPAADQIREKYDDIQLATNLRGNHLRYYELIWPLSSL